MNRAMPEVLRQELQALQPRRLLDLGCSLCPEGEELLAAGVTLVGIDQDEETIRAVRRRLPQGRFLAMDAGDFRPRERFSVVLLRRPDLLCGARSWRRVFACLPGWLAPGGAVLITTLGTAERDLALAWLREAGAERISCRESEEQSEPFLIRAEFPAQEREEEEKSETMTERKKTGVQERAAADRSLVSALDRRGVGLPGRGTESLIDALRWTGEGDSSLPAMVCDVRTGQCTPVRDERQEKNEREEEEGNG